MFVCTTVQAAYISYKSCTPESNSVISSFDFVLHFDISGAKEANPDKADTYGIGYSGSSKSHATLYKGTQETGEEIGTALTKTVNGKSATFVVGEDVSFSFPDIVPEEGVTYTLVIPNSFNVKEKGSSTSLGADYTCSFSADPLVLTFTGGKVSSTELVLISSSLKENSEADVLSELKLDFNAPIQVESTAHASIYENGELVSDASSIAVNPNDENSVIVSFDNVPLYKTHTYQVVLDEGSVSLKEDLTKTNGKYTVNIKGNGYKALKVSELTPQNDFTGILDNATVRFDLDNSLVIPENYNGRPLTFPGLLFVKIDNEYSLIGKIDGNVTEDEKGVNWVNNYELQPLTEYMFKVEKGAISVYTIDNTSTTGYKKIDDISNEDISISFTTPSIENSGLPKMTFNTPFSSDNEGRNRVEYPNGSEVDELGYLRLELTDLFYNYNGASYRLKQKIQDASGALYKISESGERLKIKDIPLGTNTFYTTEESYFVVTLTVSSRLYEGEKYQLVIPSGVYTVNNMALANFITNDEIVIDYIGKSDSNLSLTCTSLRDGERISSLSAVCFISDQELELTSNTARMIIRIKDGDRVNNSEYTLGKSTYREPGVGDHTYTRVVGDFSSAQNCTPYYLPESDDEYQVVIPAGTFALANDPDITNEEVVVNIKRVPETGLPEYVTLTSVVNEHAATVLPIEKGLKAKLQLTPSEDWKIESVKFNGKDVTANVGEDGTYETAAIRIDSRMEVTLGYNGQIYFEDSTGVAEIPDSKVRAYSDGEMINVEGLTPGDNVKVYTMAGVLIAEHDASKDIVNISANKGVIYIIVITDGNGKKAAVKINH